MSSPAPYQPGEPTPIDSLKPPTRPTSSRSTNSVLEIVVRCALRSVTFIACGAQRSIDERPSPVSWQPLKALRSGSLPKMRKDGADRLGLVPAVIVRECDQPALRQLQPDVAAERQAACRRRRAHWEAVRSLRQQRCARQVLRLIHQDQLDLLGVVTSVERIEELSECLRPPNGADYQGKEGSRRAHLRVPFDRVGGRSDCRFRMATMPMSSAPRRCSSCTASRTSSTRETPRVTTIAIDVRTSRQLEPCRAPIERREIDDRSR